MKDKINVAELLKDCPSGMELDCTMYDRVTFDEVTTVMGFDDKKRVKIILSTHYSDGTKDEINLTEYGTYTYDETAKCVIFPKGKTTWEGFHRPFRDGDIVFYSDTIAIFKEWGDETLFRAYVYTYLGYEEYLCKEKPVFGKGIRKEVRFATEEEKQKLFQAIKDNGYKWNAETKTLDKLVEPKFKIGDKIVKKNGVCVPILITKVSDEFYYSNTESSVGVLSISEQDNYELVPDKFDINTLVPFESRVLVRSNSDNLWKPAIFGCYIKNEYAPYFTLGGISWIQCIPYEGNENLLGTIDDCSEYFKTWK